MLIMKVQIVHISLFNLLHVYWYFRVHLGLQVYNTDTHSILLAPPLHPLFLQDHWLLRVSFNMYLTLNNSHDDSEVFHGRCD